MDIKKNVKRLLWLSITGFILGIIFIIVEFSYLYKMIDDSTDDNISPSMSTGFFLLLLIFIILFIGIRITIFVSGILLVTKYKSSPDQSINSLSLATGILAIIGLDIVTFILAIITLNKIQNYENNDKSSDGDNNGNNNESSKVDNSINNNENNNENND